MSRTLDDLRQTLETHSRELPLSEPRTVAVHRRIRRIRRQRISAGTAALVAASLVGTLVVHATTRSSDQVGSSKSLPEYAEGGRLVATLSVDGSLSAGSTATVVPTGSTLLIAHDPCTGPGAMQGSVFVRFVVDGRDAGGGACN